MMPDKQTVSGEASQAEAAQEIEHLQSELAAARAEADKVLDENDTLAAEVRVYVRLYVC